VRGRRPSGTATVLFTDLVGSTDLLSRLGEAAFDEVRRAHFATLRKALGRHGGEEVKTLGDGVLAVFGSASDAVSCAVAIQQAVDRQSRRGPAALAVRVGLALGDVSFEEEDVFGTPVVEAARLVAAAGASEILATAAVRWAGGSRSGASFTDRGLLELKGLPEPVPTCEVVWERMTAPSIPLPTLLTDLGRIFVGREAEVARLRQLWKDAGAGERRVVLLAGEPGVGKTRLAAELAALVHEEGAVVLAGRCDEDLGVPYQPLVEALRHFVDHTPSEDLRKRLGRYGGELVRLVPELAEQLPDLLPPLKSDPETERYRLFDAVAAWLAALSVEEPLLVVLDDLQWAAKPTLLLLRHVARASDVKRVLVVGTYRDTELAHDHPLLEVLPDLRRQGGIERISLTGLDCAGVAAFMEQAAEHALDDEDLVLARAIHEETEGNPFFVREVFRHLIETGAVERREGRWATRLPIEQIGIPESVRDVVGRRLSRLSEEANQTLRTAAAVGPEFEVPVVQAAGGLDEDALLSSLEEAAQARLITEAPSARYRFAHALVRDTLYAQLSAARQVALHRKVAEAIEALHATRLDDFLPALAHHWARASAPTAYTSKAVDYATRAGDRALAQLAHDEAVGWYRQALELLDVGRMPHNDRRRLHLLIDLGEAQRRAGDPAHRQALLDAAAMAASSGDADALTRAALANHRGFFSVTAGVDVERIAALERALDVAGPDDAPVRARLLANLADELGWSDRHERRVRLAAEALTVARRLDDPATLAHVLARRYTTLATIPARRDEMLELQQLAVALDDPALILWAGYWRSLTDLALGDMAGYHGGLDSCSRLAEELGQPTLRWAVAIIQPPGYEMAGRLEDAEERSRRALEIGQAAGIDDAFRVYATNLFWIRYDQGRLDEVLDVYERRARRPDAQPLTLAHLGIVYCEVGRVDEAQRVLDALAVDGFNALPANYAWAYAFTTSAEICAAVGDARRASTLYDRLDPCRGLVAHVGGGSTGCVDHHLALLACVLGRFEDANAHFEDAHALHEALAAPTWLARTRLEWARMLLRRCQPGDADRARGLLGQALATARELGLANVERRAVELLG
jgi:class 3 adenylate cyclase/tetratricopeptide (TPR) repeat protein